MSATVPSALVFAVLSLVSLAGCANERGSPEKPPDASPKAAGELRAGPDNGPRSTLLYLAGDGELTVVDVTAGSSRVVKLPELAGGDPPHRIVRAGDRLALWGRNAVYTVDLQVRSEPTKLAKAWFFLPSAEPDRLWLAILEPESPETVRALEAVREVTVDGRVTVSDVPPPGGGWPAAAVDRALVFEKDDVLEIWDPDTRTVPRVLRGESPGLGHGNRLPWCSPDYRRLHVTDIRTGDELAVTAPAGFSIFDCWRAAFSPDGRFLAVPVAVRTGYGADRALALVDLGRGVARVVAGSRVEPDYVFVAWSSSGASVFITGGERFKHRTLVEFRLGDERARTLRVDVGDFYGMAAS